MLNSERSAVFLDEIGQLRRMLLGFKQWVLRKNR
jgi:hypothetical protein